MYAVVADTCDVVWRSVVDELLIAAVISSFFSLLAMVEVLLAMFVRGRSVITGSILHSFMSCLATST